MQLPWFPSWSLNQLMETSKRVQHTLNRSLHGMRGIVLQCLPSVWICSPLAEVGTQMSSSCGDTYFNVQAESHFQVYFSSHTQMSEATEIHGSVTPVLERLLQTGIPPVSFQTCPGVTPALKASQVDSWTETSQSFNHRLQLLMLGSQEDVPMSTLCLGLDYFCLLGFKREQTFEVLHIILITHLSKESSRVKSWRLKVFSRATWKVPWG